MWTQTHLHTSVSTHMQRGDRDWVAQFTSWFLKWLTHIFIFLLFSTCRWGWRLPPPEAERGLLRRPHCPQSGRDVDAAGEWHFLCRGVEESERFSETLGKISRIQKILYTWEGLASYGVLGVRSKNPCLALLLPVFPEFWIPLLCYVKKDSFPHPNFLRL